MKSKPYLVPAALFLLAGAALAQSSQGPLPLDPDRRSEVQRFSDLYGTGASAPAARIVFSWDDDELCALLGTHRGPRQISHGVFAITRSIVRDGEQRNERLKFDFPKKPEIEDEDLHVRRACIPAEPAIGAQTDELNVAVREPGRMAQRDTTRFAISFPPGGAQYGMDLRRLSDGRLSASDYVPPSTVAANSEGS